ncbi:MAG: hypothetical protein ABT940_05640 [Alphaproteobacteria bacterium]
MTVSKILVVPLCAAVLALTAGVVSAQDINKRTRLGNEANGAVNSAKARQYMQSDGSDSGYQDSSDTIVHIGSAKKGDCNMNVGGDTSGRQTVVTAKNIINICK